jgi:predicted ArsR family transcriptional regulator
MDTEQQAAEAVNEHVEEQAAAVDQQFAEADAQANPDAETPPSLEDIASKAGWVPQDKFRGPAEKWKPAHQFLLDGADIQQRTSRELRRVTETLDTVAKTTGQIMAERLKEQEQQLLRRHAAAVESGDAKGAFEAATAITDLRAGAQSKPAGPDPETEDWVAKNGRVMSDPLAKQRALEVCNAYAAAGQSVSEQLANTEAVMRREFPHLFDTKGAPQVNGNINRNSAPAPKGEKSAKDLPKEARAVADDLVERGLIPSVDSYAKNYFAAEAKRA